MPTLKADSSSLIGAPTLRWLLTLTCLLSFAFAQACRDAVPAPDSADDRVSTGDARPDGDPGDTPGKMTDCPANPATPSLDCPCTGGQLACQGAAQKLRLVCKDGVWTDNGVCSDMQYCDSPSGTCKAAAAGCDLKSPGDTFCTGIDELNTCGPDLVTSSLITCAGTCGNNNSGAPACIPNRCGDGKLAGGELCDDGNAVPLDGCEPAGTPDPAAACTPSGLLSLTMGDNHTCGIYNGGYARCWGANEVGQLGLGHNDPQLNFKPHQLRDAHGQPAKPIDFGGKAVTAISARSDFSCAILADGSLSCWGANDDGQIGQGNSGNAGGTNFYATPQPVSLGASVASVAVDTGTACAALSTGAVRCWGANNGGLGLGEATSDPSSSTKPQAMGPLSLGSNATSVFSATNTFCALLTSGSIRCWGSNTRGQLGLNNKTALSSSIVPSAYGTVLLPSSSTVVQASGGQDSFCVRFSGGTAMCWGSNRSGQLGTGNFTNQGDSAAQLPTTGSPATGTTLTQIVSGIGHTCAVYSNDLGLRCWGLNTSSQLGYGDTMTRTTPSTQSAIGVGSGRSVSTVYAGNAGTCVILDNGEVHCWGDSNSNQLGYGMATATPHTSTLDPVEVLKP